VEKYKRDLDVELSVLDPDTVPMVPASDKTMFSIEEEGETITRDSSA
jgi:hypothetical protein